MHAQPADFGFLSLAVVLLATAVISVAVAELGVVLLLFLIGLELDFSRLFAMRRDIFGLGAAQLALTTAAIAALALAAGLGWRGAIIAGIALALSATAIALRILDERGHLQQTYGQRAFAILLFQDMSVVPLLALLPLLAPGGASSGGDWGADLLSVGRVAAATAALVLAGRYLLNPAFRLLAETGAREVMTAAALLVVLGAALLMQAVGMSMALGAFLAGVLLAGSNYRHELEADVEPFRGLLLALFFMGIGMTIDRNMVFSHLGFLSGGALAILGVKMAVVFGLFRLSGSSAGESLRAAGILTPAGEFSFAIFPLAADNHLMAGADASLLAALASLTMVAGPFFAKLTERLAENCDRVAAKDGGKREPAPQTVPPE